VTLADRSRLFHWRNWSRSGWFGIWSHRRSGTDWSTAVCSATGRAAGGSASVAVAVDDFVSTQAESLFSLATNTTIAVTEGTGQSGRDFGAAAAVLANLIANFISRFTTNSFISIVQTVDKGRHDLWIADAVISVAELADRSTSLTGIAGRL
jgi:hypothetical protein